jgi:Ser/Thr protein kinase RdoA (MazF antagonist)
VRASGFTAAPDVIGFDDQGREVLTFIEGETWGDSIPPDEPKTDLVVPRAWLPLTRSDETLIDLGGMLAALHRALRGFKPERPLWHEYEIALKDDEIVTHDDMGPWNIVYRGAKPVGLIDWDNAQPRRPIDDVARTAWKLVPLGTSETLRIYGFREPFETARRLRLFCDAYGLEDRRSVVSALSTVKQLEAERLRYWQPLPAGIGARHLRAIAADLEWLAGHEGSLRAAL